MSDAMKTHLIIGAQSPMIRFYYAHDEVQILLYFNTVSCWQMVGKLFLEMCEQTYAQEIGEQTQTKINSAFKSSFGNP